MSTYNFSVDAELLRELGERLVGRPHIALAELIKNSFDADATAVEIRFEGDGIVVADDGHGMSESDFATRWMRIGTTRKRSEQISPRFKRPLTGSKGVGRLSAQILAHATSITSTGMLDSSDKDSLLAEPIVASINWTTAVRQKELTSVKVEVGSPPERPVYPGGSAHGTIVVLDSLLDSWDEAAFTGLAREIWALRPPFDDESGTGMSIRLTSDVADVEASFADQMDAILKIWTAKITGTLLPRAKIPSRIDGVLPPRLPAISNDSTGEPVRPIPAKRVDRFLRIRVDLANGASRTVYYRVPAAPIDSLRFEIRVFNLQRRQPLNVAVADAREYLMKYGGVGIYDGGFRLPYYGVEQDWLNSERDHARRLDRSVLVPAELQVKRGLLDLPPNARVFGWVRVSTSHEEQVARAVNVPPHEALSIQVTRDRLTDNAAYQQLRVLVRTGLDLYAMETARQKLEEAAARKRASPIRTSAALEDLATAITEARAYLPEPRFDALNAGVRYAIESSRAAEEASRAYASLLGALATAGSTSLAYEHEISKQVAALRDLETDLAALVHSLPEPAAGQVNDAVTTMRAWQDRVAGIRAVFGPLLSKESRDTISYYRARPTILKVAKDIEPLAKGIKVDASAVPHDLQLPAATLPAWTSIFQNLFINSYNALSDVGDPKIQVVGSRGRTRSLLSVVDNGIGVDMSTADGLWQPFERKLFLPPEKEEAGLGGMGLGLTIVRMIADEIGVSVKFIDPPAGMSTAVQLEWKTV